MIKKVGNRKDVIFARITKMTCWLMNPVLCVLWNFLTGSLNKKRDDKVKQEHKLCLQIGAKKSAKFGHFFFF